MVSLLVMLSRIPVTATAYVTERVVTDVAFCGKFGGKIRFTGPTLEIASRRRKADHGVRFFALWLHSDAGPALMK